jgi:hypothetical protein
LGFFFAQAGQCWSVGSSHGGPGVQIDARSGLLYFGGNRDITRLRGLRLLGIFGID